MEQNKSKKPGIFNALKKRFWSGNFNGKSCFKKRGSKLKPRTESSLCESNPCGNNADCTLETTPENASERARSTETSRSKPVNDGDIPTARELSHISEVVLNSRPIADSVVGHLPGEISIENKLEVETNYIEPRTSEQYSQESVTNSASNSPSHNAAQLRLHSELSESQYLVENESSPEIIAGNQNQFDSNLKSGLLDELLKLSKCGWYWGNISKKEAEEKLTDQPDGAFLLRDSSADHFLLSLSFRSSGKTLHTRIVYSLGLGLFSFYQQPDESFTSIAELIEHSMLFSKSAVYCYSRPRSPGHPAFPVRLTKPVSRFAQVRSLQHLCRFVIRESIRLDNIQKLPLPPSIKGYIEEGHY